MSIQWSTAVRNARLSAIPSTVGASALLQLYSGVEPANCAAALSGNTLLVSFAMAATWTAAPSGGTMALSNLPLQATAAAGGNASFYRIYETTDTTCHEQGTITANGGGGDLTLDNINIASGQLVQITELSKTEPGA